eukprot:TRINITY_DN74664_c0_g1_i1.p1 TRINITY_DN74664_c0_g1~~TRINITY_DN74664_c0_g1_i1.p1  ORF type:complete len:241 (-),score=25.45 TRINITY_DN74664_c0_g1_i1:88-810(-)
MAFPYATICVQGLKDNVSREALFSQFEEFGRVLDVTVTPNRHMKGVPDSKIALVEFRKKEDARKAMQALNGRSVQGKCVMIRFARSAPGVRPNPPPPRHGAPELIPQTASHASLLAAKFKLDDGKDQEEKRSERSKSRRDERRRAGSRRRSRSRDVRRREGEARQEARRSPRAERRSRSRQRDRSSGRSRRESSRDRDRRNSDRRERRSRSHGEVADWRRPRGDDPRRERSPSRWRPSDD